MKNLIIRTISGLAFIIVMIGSILWGVLPYAMIMGLIIAAMMNEFINISAGKNYPLQKGLAITTGLLLFVTVLLVKFFNAEWFYLLLPLVPLTLIFISNLYIKEFNIHNITSDGDEKQRHDNGFEKIPFILSSIVYIAVPMSMCNLIVCSNSSGNIEY